MVHTEPVTPGVAPRRVGPPIPLGRRVQLSRGQTFFREVPGPDGAVPVVLIHGWLASGGLNWFQVFDPLGARYRVIAPDLCGHARGVRTRRRFRLADAADDVAELLEHLDVGPAVVVGYSMGGPVAQLLWRRHPERVGGLVFCATSSAFTPGMRERFVFTSVMAAAAGGTRLGQRVTSVPLGPIRRALPPGFGPRSSSMAVWTAAEMRRHSMISVLEAGQAVGNFNARRWVGDIDVPTAVLVTTRDRAIKPTEQARLAFAIPGATVHRIEDGHVVCMKPVFAPAVVAAVDDVASRLR